MEWEGRCVWRPVRDVKSDSGGGAGRPSSNEASVGSETAGRREEEAAETGVSVGVVGGGVDVGGMKTEAEAARSMLLMSRLLR